MKSNIQSAIKALKEERDSILEKVEFLDKTIKGLEIQYDISDNLEDSNHSAEEIVVDFDTIAPKNGETWVDYTLAVIKAFGEKCTTSDITNVVAKVNGVDYREVNTSIRQSLYVLKKSGRIKVEVLDGNKHRYEVA